MRAYATILAIALTGCVPSYPVVDQPPSIQATYASRLSQIKTGITSISDYQKLFPEAYPGGQNDDTTAYEIRDTQTFIMRADVRRPLDTAVGIYSPQQTVTQVLPLDEREREEEMAAFLARLE